MAEFFVPVQASDLELEHNDGRYYVQSKMEPSYMAEMELLNMVSDVKERLKKRYKSAAALRLLPLHTTAHTMSLWYYFV